MLYVYQIDITSTLQTLGEFQYIIQCIFLEIHAHIHNSLNQGNRYIILTNENPESTQFDSLVQSKLDAMHEALQYNPHILAAVNIQSLFGAPGGDMQSIKRELLRLTQSDKSMLMTLYYGMHYIAIREHYMTPIIFTLHGGTIEMPSIMSFFLLRNLSTDLSTLIPFGMKLKLKPVYEHYYTQINGIGLAHTRYLECMQMMMAPYMDASQPFIDLCDKLMRSYSQDSTHIISSSYPVPMSPEASHPPISGSSYLFFKPQIRLEPTQALQVPLGDNSDLDTSFDLHSATTTALDYDKAAVDALIGIRASHYQLESDASDSDLPSSQELATHIDLDNIQAVNRWAIENNFTYIHDASPTLNLMIDRVAVLGPCEKLWGVYTKQPIQVGSRLGDYKGERVHLTDNITNLDYIFKFTTEDDEHDAADVIDAIDAREKRNWTAFVNTASSFETANVEALVEIDPQTHLPSIFYQSSKPISAGDQLLIYYGDDYVLSKIRYLNPKNNALESSQIFQRNVQHYLTKAQSLPVNFANLFNIPEQQLFKVVYFSDHLSEQSSCQIKRARIEAKEQSKLDSQLNVDLPFLALTREQKDNDSFLPQQDQENITALMFACWSGYLEMIDFLLKHNANPNLQSSIQGIYALHIIVASEVPFEVKKSMFNLFYAPERIAKPYLHLQDQKNQTVLHWAIKKQDLKLVKFLLDLDREIQKQNIDTKKQSKKALKSNLMNCIDDDDRDPFLLSLFLGLHDIAEELFHLTCHFDALGNYLKKESLDLLGSYMEEESIDLLVASLIAYKEKTGGIDLIESILKKIEAIDGCEPQKIRIGNLVSVPSTLKMRT